MPIKQIRFKILIIFLLIGLSTCCLLTAIGIVFVNRNPAPEPKKNDYVTTGVSKILIGIEYAVEGEDAASFGTLGI